MTVKHSDIFKLFSKILPNEELVYHSPLPPNRPYDPTTTRFIASKVILSLTPSEAVYSTLHKDPKSRSILFLHRPFRLDRRRVPHGTLVLSSHVRYDELLTTGWNEALADEHSILPRSIDGDSPRRCIQGYKNNPERRIGLVGLLKTPTTMQEYAQDLSKAFEGHEELHLSENGTGQIKVLACMNAFTPEIIDRIVQTSKELNIDSKEVLCLTGAARELGIEAARENGMSIIAVGHKRCEMWGLKYLEREARKAFPNCEIVLHEEDEEPLPRTSKATRQGGGAPNGGKKPEQR